MNDAEARGGFYIRVESSRVKSEIVIDRWEYCKTDAILVVD